MQSVYDFNARGLDGQDTPLRRYEGNVLLIVNTASRCGFTPQFEGLEKLHHEFSSRGFSVLGFPCNQFAKQEPGEAGEIASFCSLNYGVSFPMFDKINVNGAQVHPLFKMLKHRAPGLLGFNSIKWNFTKFLVDRSGRSARRYAPKTKPQDLRNAIAALL